MEVPVAGSAQSKERRLHLLYKPRSSHLKTCVNKHTIGEVALNYFLNNDQFSLCTFRHRDN